MTNTFHERLTKNKQDAARDAFAGYVQSVAFNMTLSRHMVDALGAVRDFGSGWQAANAGAVPAHIGSHSAPLMAALLRRGLVFHDWIDNAPAGHRYFKLTRAGELMCDLLVEAKLIAPVVAANKRGKASA